MFIQELIIYGLQAVAFLPKVMCDVSQVEIATGMRLTSTSVEGFSIRVPRTRRSYFQNDLYPETRCVEESNLTAEKWLSGESAVQQLCSMRPPNMKLCKAIMYACSPLILCTTLMFLY